MTNKVSWAALHKMTARERREVATNALRQARRQGADFFAEDGTITLRPATSLFQRLFTGKVDSKRASNLVKMLQEHGVISSNGQRGRRGATLRLLEGVELQSETTPQDSRSAPLVETASSEAQLPGEVTDKTSAPQRGDVPPRETGNADVLLKAYQATQRSLIESQQALNDLEAALALSDLLKTRGLELGDLDRIIEVLKNNS